MYTPAARQNNLPGHFFYVNYNLYRYLNFNVTGVFILHQDVLFVLIFLLSSFVSGVSGFGFSMIAVALLTLLLDVKMAVVFMSAHTLTVNILQLIRLRRHISLKEIIPLLAGAIAGVPGGVYLLKNMDPWWIKKMLGLVVIWFVLQQIIYSRKQHDHSDHPPESEPMANKKETLAGFLVGTVSGVLMGGILSGGPPVMIYSLKKFSDKYQIKTILQSFFLFSGAYAMLLYISSGLLTVPVLLSSIIYLPATIAGTVLGIMVFEAISSVVFHSIAIVFMTLLGLSLLLK